MRFGFQMKVDSSIADGRDGHQQPRATSPATGPPIARASHHVTPTAAIPESAISSDDGERRIAAGQRAAGASRK